MQIYETSKMDFVFVLDMNPSQMYEVFHRVIIVL